MSKKLNMIGVELNEVKYKLIKDVRHSTSCTSCLLKKLHEKDLRLVIKKEDKCPIELCVDCARIYIKEQKRQTALEYKQIKSIDKLLNTKRNNKFEFISKFS